MDTRIQEMLDHYEIRKTLCEYCHGLDRVDQTRMASIYAKDNWDDHGSYKGPGEQFAKSVLEFMKAGGSSADHHMLGQSLIKVDGNEAGADTYFIASIRRLEQDGSEVLLQLGGRYVDKFLREEGRWKVKRRVCVRDWSITLSLRDDWAKNMEFVQGKRSNEDPSFAVLGIEHSGLPK